MDLQREIDESTAIVREMSIPFIRNGQTQETENQ